MFVVERPSQQGEISYFSVAFPAPRVIEVEVIDEYSYRVVAPEGFPWPTLRQGLWLEVGGPARVLTDLQYCGLLQECGLPELALQYARHYGRVAGF